MKRYNIFIILLLLCVIVYKTTNASDIQALQEELKQQLFKDHQESGLGQVGQIGDVIDHIHDDDTVTHTDIPLQQHDDQHQHHHQDQHKTTENNKIENNENIIKHQHQHLEERNEMPHLVVSMKDDIDSSPTTTTTNNDNNNNYNVKPLEVAKPINNNNNKLDSKDKSTQTTTDTPTGLSEGTCEAPVKKEPIYTIVDLKNDQWDHTVPAYDFITRSNRSTDRTTVDLNYSTKKLKQLLRRDAKEMFYHGYHNYMKYAYPTDELKSITCQGSDEFGQYSLTYLDALDALLVFDDLEEFRKGVNWVVQNVHFKKDVNVSVFETNIRILGGLLSAHLLAEINLPEYKGELLPISLEIGEILLKAFNTPTGIPYGTINLLSGVQKGESFVTCTAAAGTFALEFGILSKLTGKPEFERAAKKAAKALWYYRSSLELVGNHVDITNGEWTIKESGIGTGIDSYFEYLLKAAIYFDDQEYLDIFIAAYRGIYRYIRKEPWYVEVSMNKALIVWPIYNSLQSFWPGLQTLAGEFEDSISTAKAFHAVWRRFGALPEGYNLMAGQVQQTQEAYPLRPELAESFYYLYAATRDASFIKMGRDMIWTLNNITRTRCGFATIKNVETHTFTDKMESFFLSETIKYLYMMFSEGDQDALKLIGNGPFIFNTEGHIFPMQLRFFEKDKSYNESTPYQPPPPTLQQQQQSANSDSCSSSSPTSTSTSSPPSSHNEREKRNSDQFDLLFKDIEETNNWKCPPPSYLRTISSGSLQFLGPHHADYDWYDDPALIKEFLN